MQRLQRFAVWILPSASAVFSVVVLTWRWVGDRASTTDVAMQIAPIALAAKAAQAEAFHASSVVKDHEYQIEKAWAEVVSLHAELEVYRRYGNKDAHTRGNLIDEGIRFFQAEYATQLEHHPNDPAEAARRALLARWRPDPR